MAASVNPSENEQQQSFNGSSGGGGSGGGGGGNAINGNAGGGAGGDNDASDFWWLMDFAYFSSIEFDRKYGGGWQCVVGSNFGCYFSHSKGTFIYFTLETLNFLVFGGAVAPIATNSP
ncbi:hypothetical protein Droror1_Dr00006503 [Drosera rotundifolia]